MHIIPLPVIKFTICVNYKNTICGCVGVCVCAYASKSASCYGHFCVVEQIYSMICTQNVHDALVESGQNRIKHRDRMYALCSYHN